MDMDREHTHPPPVRCSTGDHHSGFDYLAILMSRGCNHHRRNEGRRPGPTVHEPARAVLTTDVLNGATRGSPHASEPTRSTAPWKHLAAIHALIWTEEGVSAPARRRSFGP